MKLTGQPDEPLYTRADAQGHFAFRNLHPAGYSLAVESPGFLQPRTATVDLTPTRPGGYLGGVISSYPPSAVPVLNAVQGFAMTDEKGTFSTTVPQAGDYHPYVANEVSQGGEEEYLKAHEKDFPLLRVVDGDNPALTLVWRGK